MIPIQDVVPTPKTPALTLSLIALNITCLFVPIEHWLATPFMHVGLGSALIGSLFVWLFGDNVEARLGWVTMLGVYLSAGWIAGLGATGAITAIVGSYFVLLPRSRVFMLVPAPPVLVEVPAVVFLAMWSALQLTRFIAVPRTLWAYGLALGIGAAAAAVMKRPVKW